MFVLWFTRSAAIGVDVEYQEREINYLELAKRFFSIQEFQILGQLSPEQLKQGFFQVWTGKEAFIKAVGQGLYFPLDQFVVNADPKNKQELLDIVHPDYSIKDWQLQGIYHHPDYAYSVVSPRNILHFDLHLVQLSSHDNQLKLNISPC